MSKTIFKIYELRKSTVTRAGFKHSDVVSVSLTDINGKDLEYADYMTAENAAKAMIDNGKIVGQLQVQKIQTND